MKHKPYPTKIRFGIAGDYIDGALLGLPVSGGVYLGQWRLTFGDTLQATVGLDHDDLRDLADNLSRAMQHLIRNGTRSSNAWMLDCRNGLHHVLLETTDSAKLLRVSIGSAHFLVSVAHAQEAIGPCLDLAKALDAIDRQNGVR